MLFTCICLTLGLLFIPVQKSNQCDIPRMTLLAGMYYRGEGVARNPEAAIRWFQQAAEQGDLNSEKMLGAAYERGDGVAQDSTEAVRWAPFMPPRSSGDNSAMNPREPVEKPFNGSCQPPMSASPAPPHPNC